VKEDPNSNTWQLYSTQSNYMELNSESRTYWVSEVSENQYEISFGDGFFGKKLQNGAEISITYLRPTGEISNGIQGGVTYPNNFTFVGMIYDNNQIRANSTFEFTNDFISDGASAAESVSSIKLRAPKFYATQQRCVIEDDYETIIRQIYPGVDDIYVYGGETLPIPEYGRVYVVIKPSSGQLLSNSTKLYIKQSLEKYRIASLDIKIVNPEVLYVECESVVHYDKAKTNKDRSIIVSDVKTALNNFANSPTVAKFGGAIRYSRIVGAIDDANPAITRNNTSLKMRRDFTPLINTAASYEICFENRLKDISSSQFLLMIEGKLDPRVFYFEDDNRGRIRTYYYDSNNKKQIDNPTFGTVNYAKGEIFIGREKSVTFASQATIQVRSIPITQDVIANGMMYLELDVSESDIVAQVESV
jgi:hypothetical protein